MADERVFGDVAVGACERQVTLVEIRRGPDNFFDRELIADIADALETLDADPSCRAVVLCAEGKHFCAGARLARRDALGDDSRHLYDEAIRVFATRKPIVAAIQGAAVGGGLGLALVADLRVATRDARFSANFARLGFHHGFALTVTLPALVGQQRAMELLYTGRRVPGEEAHTMGICDRLVSAENLRDEAVALAREIALSAPLAVAAIRETLRGDIVERARRAMAREREVQERLQKTADFREGVAAMAERRTPQFTGS
jgi:2-(1,2-epoxy-1,2-dihydrophenyl)acetyl-CoA isomerase